MPQRPAPPFRAAAYMRLLVVELSAAFLMAALAFLPLLLLRSLFSPAAYALLLTALALSLLAVFLRWRRSGVRSVELDAEGFTILRGQGPATVRIPWTDLRNVRPGRGRIVVRTAGTPSRLVIRSDGFPAPVFAELGRRLASRRPHA